MLLDCLMVTLQVGWGGMLVCGVVVWDWELVWVVGCIGLTRYIMCRVGQNRTYTVYVQCFWQGEHQMYGHIRRIYTVPANPSCVVWNALCAS